jgi:chemotaxis family two-component system sensor histidine kinase/response regulator PixL
MLNPEIRDQAYQFFIEEAVELLHLMETGLLNLKNNKDTAKVHEIMRAAHSIKGGSASVGLDSIKSISHRLEDIFKALYHDTVVIDTELESQLLQAFDCLRQPLIQQIETGSHEGELALAKAIPLFEQIEEKLGDAMNADEYIPSSSDLGIDMVASMFDIDVGQEIDRLKSVLANPQAYQVGGELRAAAEVFAGFAELLNLPGFAQIAKTAEQALEKNPAQAIAITQVAVADFMAAREQVLAGDRTLGGSPSPTLLAFINENPSEIYFEEQLSELDDIFGEVEEQLPELDDIFGEVESENDHLESEFENFENIDTEEAEKIAQPVNLSEAVASLGQIWEKLPTLEEEQKIKVTPKRKLSETSKITTIGNKIETPPPQVLEEAQQQAKTNLSVRVDLNRLERMNNLVGELTINRNSLSLQNEQLQSNVRELIRRFNKFQTITNKFRDLSDKTLVAAEKEKKTKTNLNGGIVTEITEHESEFDSLEMDTYNQIHYLLQDVLEEMMQVEESVDDITLFARLSNQTLQFQRQMLTNLRDELMWARMLPLSEILNRFPRVLRDLSTQYNKPINFSMTGVGVLVDKVILEKLYDPLMHLVRNAFDHGIESIETRQQAGKNLEGEITIQAYHKGNQTIIEIKDDGQGINLEKIRNKALQKNVITPEQALNISKERLFNLIFEPGFSTADKVSEISGRGVGLDIVRSQLRAIKGSVSVISSEGEGTIFILSLPLTLTISKLLVCLFGNSAFALPSDSVEEIIIPDPQQIKKTGSGTFFHWQNQLIPHYKLSDLLQYNCPLPPVNVSKALTVVDAPQDWAFPLLILRREQHTFALEVERLVTEQELVIKPFGSVMKAPSYTYGCTILADGSIIPVIDGTLLIDYHNQYNSPDLATSDTEIENSEPISHRTIVASRILVVDDSSALRRTLALSLEKAGYLVLQAKDGREALTELNKNPTINLVICDIEMPNMNGFEFLSQRRLKPELLQIPVAMLTSRGNPKHRQLAMQLGANAYFTKPYIEQEFITEIAKIIRANNSKRKST